MEVTLFHQLYNSYGGFKSFCVVGDYLSLDIPNFGTAIDDLYITFHFKQDGPARKSLEDLHENFHKNLSKLPKCTFYRKKKTLQLEILATFTTGQEINRNSKAPIQINPEWARATFDVISEHLSVIKAKLKASDNFDFDAFRQYFDQKLKSIPTDKTELDRIQKIASDLRKEAREKLDDWEKLGLPWDDYHPNARDIVSLPFQWSNTDEFSPNGNDTGADVLAMFEDWNKKNKSNPMIFLRELFSGWEVDISKPYESEYTSYTYFQGVVGLAFASCKLRGVCEVELRDMAIEAIDKYLDDIEGETSWEHLDDCMNKQKLSRKTLKAMPSP